MGMTAVYACMNIMYIPFIRIYTTGMRRTKLHSSIAAFLFVVNGIAYNIKTQQVSLSVRGLFKETKPATIIQTVIAIGLCLVLTPYYGITSLLIALIISNIYRDIEHNIYVETCPWRTVQDSFLRIGLLIVFVLCNYHSGCF